MKKSFINKIAVMILLSLIVLSLTFFFLSSNSLRRIENELSTVAENLLEEDLKNKNIRDLNSLSAYGENLGKYLSEITAMPLWNFDLDVVMSYVENLSNLPDIEYSVIYDASNNVVAGEKNINNNLLVFETPIRYQDRNIGKTEIGISKNSLALLEKENEEIKSLLINSFKNSADHEIKNQLRFVIITQIILLVIIMAISFVLLTKIASPLKKIQGIVSDLNNGEGDLTVRLHLNSRDEIGNLSKALNGFMENFSAIVKRISSNANIVDSKSLDINNIVKTQNDFAKSILDRIVEIEENSYSISSSLEEISASVEEVASNAATVSMSAERINESSVITKKSINESNQSSTVIAGKMKEVKIKMEIMDKSVDELSDNANNIGSMLDAINSIAEQTNLLALNAAIEAARAGEAGRGFAVVADEIRKLAEDSKSSTEKIEIILSKISGKSQEVKNNTIQVSQSIDEVSKISYEVNKQLTDAFSKTNEMAEMIEKSLELSKEQSYSTEQIAQSITLASQNTADITNNFKLISEDVEKLKQGLNNLSEYGDNLKSVSYELLIETNKFKIC